MAPSTRLLVVFSRLAFAFAFASRPLGFIVPRVTNLLLGGFVPVHTSVHDSSSEPTSSLTGGEYSWQTCGATYPPGSIRLREYRYAVCMSITYFISVLDDKSN